MPIYLTHNKPAAFPLTLRNCLPLCVKKTLHASTIAGKALCEFGMLSTLLWYSAPFAFPSAVGILTSACITGSHPKKISTVFFAILSGQATGAASAYYMSQPIYDFVYSSEFKTAGYVGIGMIILGGSLWTTSSCLLNRIHIKIPTKK